MQLRMRYWCIVALMAMLDSAIPSEDESRRVQLHVQPMLYNQIHEGMPLPVCVILRNAGNEFQGVIQAWFEDSVHDRISRQVRVGKGSFRFFLYPLKNVDYDQTLYVSLLDRKGRQLVQPYALDIGETQFYHDLQVGLISEKRVLFGRRLLLPDDIVGLRLNQSLLPDDWYGFLCLDALCWDALDMNRLSIIQRTALKQWVQSGGLLLIVGMRDDHVLQSPLPELLDAQTIMDALSGRVPSGDSLYGHALERHENYSLIRCRVGSGSVLFIGLNARNAEPVKIAWKSIIERGLKPGRDDSSLFKQLAEQLGYTRLSFMSVLVLMLVYLVWISLGDYLLLRSLRKLVWTWFTFPMAIALFSYLSYALFYQGTVGTLWRAEVLLKDIAPDGCMKTVSWNAMKNNSMKPIRFRVQADHFIRREGYYAQYNWNRRYSDENGMAENIYMQDQKEIVIPAHIGSFRFFCEEKPPDYCPNPPFRARLQIDSHGLQGFVQPTVEVEYEKILLMFHRRIFKTRRMVVSNNDLPGVDKQNAVFLVDDDKFLQGFDDDIQWVIEHSKRHYGDARRLRRMIYPDRDSVMIIAFRRYRTQKAGITRITLECVRQVVPLSIASSGDHS